MDWVDDAVRGAAPRALGADLATAEQAEALARTVAARSRQPARVSRFRRFLTGSALGIGILGLGVTAATAGPAVFEWVGWTPDVVAQRSFTFDDRSDVGLCEVFVRVVPDYRDLSIEKVERRTEEARQFLAEHDWDPVIESITVNEIEAALDAERAQREAITTHSMTPPPATISVEASRLMANRIIEEFERAGHMQPGVSIESAGHCGDTTQGPTQ